MVVRARFFILLTFLNKPLGLLPRDEELDDTVVVSKPIVDMSSDIRYDDRASGIIFIQ